MDHTDKQRKEGGNMCTEVNKKVSCAAQSALYFGTVETKGENHLMAGGKESPGFLM